MSTTPSAIRDAVDEAPHRVLQRLIMPLSPTLDVIPLYLEAHAARSGAHTAAFGLGSAPEESHETAAGAGTTPAPPPGRVEEAGKPRPRRRRHLVGCRASRRRRRPNEGHVGHQPRV